MVTKALQLPGGFLVWLLVVVCAIGLSQTTRAEEKIENLVSQVTVRPDALLEKRETIIVNSESDQIKRGLLYRIPSAFKDRTDREVKTELDVLEVRRDGNPEPFTIEPTAQSITIRIGHKDIFIGKGQHIYEVHFLIKGPINYFESYDALYWTAGVAGWSFPVERATVMLELPKGAELLQATAGVAGTVLPGLPSADFRTVRQQGNQFQVETTRRLEPFESLSVAVAWQKGFVKE